MNAGPESTSSITSAEEAQAPTPVQAAIRARALDTIAHQQSQPVRPLSRRLLILGLTLAAMLMFVVIINFVITGMHKILDIWYPGSISGEVTPPEPPPLRPDQPFYITVEPAQQVPVPTASASSSATVPTR